MLKAFDTIDHDKLLFHLKHTVDDDELHIIYILLTANKFRVQCGKTTGLPITTNAGTPQGDSLSPILFIYYMAKAMQSPDLQY